MAEGLFLGGSHHIHCALYLYYYYISSTSDHHVLDSRDSTLGITPIRRELGGFLGSDSRDSGLVAWSEVGWDLWVPVSHRDVSDCS